MSYSFEYIDIILLAMIAGFIFLRLRGILGKKSGFEEDITQSFPHEFPNSEPMKKTNFDVFDDKAKKEFMSGAKIAYETIITDFSKVNLKSIKDILEKNVFKQFESAIQEREKQGNKSETTFIGINSAEIKNHERNGNFLEVTVDFVSEIITCIRDKDKKVISGSSEKIKTVYDTWIFSKDINSINPNWILIETIT